MVIVAALQGPGISPSADLSAVQVAQFEDVFTAGGQI